MNTRSLKACACVVLGAGSQFGVSQEFKPLKRNTYNRSGYELVKCLDVLLKNLNILIITVS